MAELVKSGFRVSVRELREESYRALRSKGYDWGQAQAASRVATEAQILWGSGLSAIQQECTRFRGKKRLPLSRGQGVMANRGSSFPIWGPMAAALAVSRAPSEIRITGVICSKTLAVAFWDLDEFSSWTWGDGKCRFAIDPKGDLIGGDDSATRKSTLQLGKYVDKLADFQVLITADQRKQALMESLTNGVEVDSSGWEDLKKNSRKFLVPE